MNKKELYAPMTIEEAKEFDLFISELTEEDFTKLLKDNMDLFMKAMWDILNDHRKTPS